MEMCPACGKISNMVTSTSIRTVADSSGGKRGLILFHFTANNAISLSAAKIWKRQLENNPAFLLARYKSR